MRAAGFLLRCALVLLISLALLEAALRARGLFKARRPLAPADRTVLCVGDSFVQGVGGESFPSQLQKLLDEKQPGVYRVVNAGLAGTGSAQMLAKLPAQLKAEKPHIVIVLSGASNAWRLARNGGLAYWLRKSAAFRFFKLAAAGRRAGGGGLAALPSCGCPVSDLPLLPDSADAPPKLLRMDLPVPKIGDERLVSLYLDAARLSVSAGNCIQAVKLLETAMGMKPESSQNLAAAAGVLASCGLRDSSCELAGRAASAEAGSKTALSARAGCLMAQGNWSEAARAYDDLAGRWPAPFFRLQAAMAYFEMKNPARSLRACEEGLREFPGDADLTEEYIRELVFSGKLELAAVIYRKSRILPEHERVEKSFYGALLDAGELEAALRYCAEMSGLADSGGLCTFLGRRLAHSHPRQALALFEKAAGQCRSACRLYKAEAYLRLCEYSKARAEYEAAESEGAPKAPLMAVKAAVMACLGGKCAESSDLLRKAAAELGNPHLYRIKARLGRLCGNNFFEDYIAALRADPLNAGLLREALLAVSSDERPGRLASLVKLVPEIKSNRAFAEASADFAAWERNGEKRQAQWLSSPEAQLELYRDLAAAGALAKGAGARLVFSSYPEWEFPGVKRAALESGAKYINFTEPFSREFRSRAEYISSDGSHCNTAGYGLMARKYAAAILEMDK